MGKVADIYYETEPFAIVEKGFNKDYSKVSESVFSLGNEYIGVRGYFEEGYSGETLKGSYFNGLYERRMLNKSGYKGSLEFTEFMVNSVDWLYTVIKVNGIKLDLNNAEIDNFERRLDMKTGLLSRDFFWQVERLTRVHIRFERFLSMCNEKYAGQKIFIEALEGTALVEVYTGLDFDCIHESVGKCMFDVKSEHSEDNFCSLLAETKNTHMKVYAAASFDAKKIYKGENTCKPDESSVKLTGKKSIENPTKSVNVFSFTLTPNEGADIEKMAFLLSGRNEEELKNFDSKAKEGVSLLKTLTYGEVLKESATWWDKAWETSDVEILGDDLNQQGIRFCIFELHQTLHTAKYGAVFGAKGLTGEAYNGNTFWDSEVYCLPFYLFTNPDAAKSILKFRYDTLNEAKERAKALDLNGAFYPIATISGKECCDLWQHSNLQLQASTGVFYGLWNYIHTTNDYDFLYKYGAEMLVEISRMLASRGDYDASGKRFGFYGVMGPDEFQMMVHNNAYTNFMGKKTFEYTVKVLSNMKCEAKGDYEKLVKKTGLKEEEIEEFLKKAKDMYIPRNDETMVFEQHEGFFSLPHVEIPDIPIEDFPLYSHWAYDRLYRNDMLKQPDVLMFMMLYASEFTDLEIQNNFDYYEPRCIHESSLSPSIHSILANRLGLSKKAEDYFGFATRMDLDNYNRNTHEGLHTTSIAGAWMNIVYGFSGFASDSSVLKFAPKLPTSWEGYSYSMKVKGNRLSIKVRKNQVILAYDADEPLSVELYGKVVVVDKTEKAFDLERAC